MRLTPAADGFRLPRQTRASADMVARRLVTLLLLGAIVTVVAAALTSLPR